MDWIWLSYDFKIKHHIVHRSVLEIAELEVLTKHQCQSSQRAEDQYLVLDPGGMVFMGNEPLISDLQEGNVSVKPELLLTTIAAWKRYRELDQTLPSGEKIFKVYCNEYSVAVMPESLYHKIGAWLVKNKSEGYIARMELVEALSGHPNIMVTPPTAEGEA